MKNLKTKNKNEILKLGNRSTELVEKNNKNRINDIVKINFERTRSKER